jgi:hypothetical protein
MNAIALAQALDVSKDADGVISLHELQRRLSRLGLHELARSARTLAGYLVPGTLDVDQTAPWF